MGVIDTEGFRLNVGVVIANAENRVLWARRVGQDAWQFPQGGIHPDETPEQALLRELYEELGLAPEDVAILGVTKDWLSYRIPKQMLRHYSQPLCVGQKQKWFLLRLVSSDQKVRLDLSSSPEFDSWRWVEYWYPVKHVIEFKREVYQLALQELEKFI